jgi:hypothetical protein
LKINTAKDGVGTLCQSTGATLTTPAHIRVKTIKKKFKRYFQNKLRRKTAVESKHSKRWHR